MRALLLMGLPLLCALAQPLLSPMVPTPPPPTTRHFYIAAVEIGWDYVFTDGTESASEQRLRSKDVPQKYIKAVYREYTDSKYSTPTPRPAWAGLQGPVIRAQAGDRLVVHFKNLASESFSISPVGITYWKQSEGAGYEDSTGGQEKQDDAVSPGGSYVYVWDISAKDGPTSSDPECLTYSYSSQVDTVRDLNSGLVGALLICKSSAFGEDGLRRSPEFVLLFAVFDETKSWYGEVGERRTRERYRKSSGRKEYHTINGYINATLPGLTMCLNERSVFWHLIGVGTAPEIHSIQFQDHSLQVMSQRKLYMEMTPMTFTTAEMRPASKGRFLISCRIHAHKDAGMNAVFSVEDCPAARGPTLYHVKHQNYDDYSDYDNAMFNSVDFQAQKPGPQIRASRGRRSSIRMHFIAAEEVTWNYASHLKPTDRELQSEYFRVSPEQLGFQYKKAVFLEYTDATFTAKKTSDGTLQGPLLKGEVNDQVHIIFKNMASRPYNIYPTGLISVQPLDRTQNKEAQDLRSMGVPPNTTFSYVWKLGPDSGPLEGDPQCLTQLYQSTVHPERDLASGLVGTLLICKYEAIDHVGRLVGPDQEMSMMFAVFDENRSWYIDQNIHTYSSDPSKVDPSDPDFLSSNIIYSVNGGMFRGREFATCQSDVTFWHVVNVGTQSDFLSVYFRGNPIKRQDANQWVLTLFPMTGETIPMEAELIGEWEISAFDGNLKSRGMSVRYTVTPCDDNPLVDREDSLLKDYVDNMMSMGPRAMGPRAMRPHNRTGAGRRGNSLRNIQDPSTPDANATRLTEHADRNDTNEITPGYSTAQNATGTPSENATETPPEGDADNGIPQAVLEALEREEERLAALDPEGRAPRGRGRKRRLAVDGDEVMREEREGGSADGEAGGGVRQTRGMSGREGSEAGGGAEERGEATPGKNETREETNHILEDSSLLTRLKNAAQKQVVPRQLELDLEEVSRVDPQPGEAVDPVELRGLNHTDNRTAPLSLSMEYEDYSSGENDTFSEYGTMDHVDPRSGTGDNKYRNYYIAAEEVTWDYGIRIPPQLIRPREMRRGMRKFLPEYKKVVFRAYTNGDFKHPVVIGELQEHLGIMGPFIRAEVHEQLTVTFRNKASRPYSFHLQGVYDKSQGGGMAQTQTDPTGVPGEAVPPGESRVYTWKITKKQGPYETEFACKAGAYYSTVNKEKDLHSGLIGPLVICRPNTLDPKLGLQADLQEYALLFHSFDETKSWYLEENLRRHCTPPCRAVPTDPWFQTSNTFAAINGYVAETLPGLLVAQHQRVRWHLLNVGGDGEYHAVHFHGLAFNTNTERQHRAGVFNLYPGVFGTVEMRPPMVGTWLVECTVGDYQLAGMRAKMLVYDPLCVLPLGMKSGRIEDFQITDSDHIGYWGPNLARLDMAGSTNAWMGNNIGSWLQVDMGRPTLVHGLQTQGASAGLRDYFVSLYELSYSLDQLTWHTYRGNQTLQRYVFKGNMDSSSVKDHRLSPPIVARYVRIQPLVVVKKPALRLELLGCDLNSCSMPLGLQRRKIPDGSFSASSVRSSWRHTWSAKLARLHQGGSANAWRPKNNNPHEWLQVDLQRVQRVTGLVTQGARALLTHMMVTEFSVALSNDGRTWSTVLEEETAEEKIFSGNSDPDEESLALFEPPVFARYLRVQPRGWINDIALRLEVLGCDTQQRT
ncbi:coagulation factor VIII [Gadus chalcogrammus]|uniref:coagulation factor VIII n=1 Tax=Gadus chalcogrammus TaxID=1042646 RepID=UPI0024C4DFD8|nr:coagulation factor VIII [Gadus chalcogrammus]